MRNKYIFTSTFFTPAIFILFVNILIKLWLARFFANDKTRLSSLQIIVTRVNCADPRPKPSSGPWSESSFLNTWSNFIR